MDNMYTMLISLPLFNGVSKEKLTEIVGNTKLHFLKYPAGEQFIKAGDNCTHLQFIISGSVKSEITNKDGRFTVSQTLNAPTVISPDFIFGRHTTYPCSVTALEPTGILQIDKCEYLKILQSDQIFILNYLNLLSMNAQKAVDGILAVATGSLEERIAFWIVAMTQPAGEDIVLSCRHRDIYSLFGVQRSSFINTLNRMKESGIITYTNNSIKVLDRRKMIDLLQAKID